MNKIKALHIAGESLIKEVWIDLFQEKLKEILDLKILEEGYGLSEKKRLKLIREYEILLTNWKSPIVPDELAENPGKLRYICNITGSVKKYISGKIIHSPIIVSNWGDAPSFRIAEGAMTLLLALLKDLPARKDYIRSGGWCSKDSIFSASLKGLNIGMYGFGVIGSKLESFLRPFGPFIRVFDPYVQNLPETCIALSSKEELFETSQVITVHAALSDETRGSIKAADLAKLPDKGIIINTARGAIFDQQALFAELKSGRLKAGLDVLDPDDLPAGHEARQWSNVIFTAHEIGQAKRWPQQSVELDQLHINCLNNLNNYIAGRKIRFQFDPIRYERST